MSKYLAVYEKSSTGFGVYVPNLSGCVATGRTLEETRQRIELAIEMHLAAMKEDGDPIPEPSELSCGSEAGPSVRVVDVHLTDDLLWVELADGQTIAAPIAWYPRLLAATPEQRSNWQLSSAGFGIHWPDIDEDLSTAGLLRGAPAAAGAFPN